MRVLVLLAFAASCSNSPVPTARADASQAPSAQPPVAKPEAVVGKPAVPSVPLRYSKLMGVRLIPSEQVREAGAALIKENDDHMLGNAIRRDCGSREDYIIDSVPAFRENNLIMAAFLKDAQDIGWKLTLRKGFTNAALYDGVWHGIRTDVLMLTTDPKFVYISICQPTPTVSPAKR